MKHSNLVGGACALAAAMTIAGAASAQPMTAAPVAAHVEQGGVVSSDPVMRSLRLRAKPGTFVLTNSLETASVRNGAGRTLHVCLAGAGHSLSPAATIGRNEGAAAVPLSVSWNGNVATLGPGACLDVGASEVTLRPAGQMPAGAALMGRVTEGTI